MMTIPTITRGAILLKRWRGKRDQKDVCELLGLDRPTYSKIEGGRIVPGGIRQRRIEEVTRRDGKTVTIRSWWVTK